MRNPSLLLLLALLAGCAAPMKLQNTERLSVVNGTALPVPGRAELLRQNRAYLIGAFDKLTVDVFGVAELSKQVQVDAAGTIQMPLIGGVAATGLSPEALAQEIVVRLRGRFVRDPQVTVNLVETASQIITMDGEVSAPGLYPVIGRMTLMRAVATAKGTTEFAKTTDVVVFREVGGRQYAALYDLKAIREGRYDDPEVYGNDVVIVGNSPSRRLFKDLIQLSPLLSAPLIALVN